MTDLKMPKREPTDGALTVRRIAGTGHIELIEERDGHPAAWLIVSEYNAWRLFGMMALILGIPLSKAVAKTIKLGGDVVGKVR